MEVLLEFTIEGFIRPVLGALFELGYMIYTLIVPKPADRDAMSDFMDVILTVLGSILIGVLILAIIGLFV